MQKEESKEKDGTDTGYVMGQCTDPLLKASRVGHMHLPPHPPLGAVDLSSVPCVMRKPRLSVISSYTVVDF